MFDSTWRDQGRPQEEVMFSCILKIEQEERVGTGIPGRRSDTATGTKLGKSEVCYGTAFVSLRWPTCSVPRGGAQERWPWGGPRLATLGASVLNAVDGDR